MALTDLIDSMIKTNEEVKLEIQEARNDFSVLKQKVDTNTSDEHIVEIMKEQLIQDEYFTSERFYDEIGQGLIDKYGLASLITLDKAQVKQAVREYLQQNLDSQMVSEYIMQDYATQLHDTMVRRIRIESKSILDNYDFSLQVIPRLQVLFKEFMQNYELTSYLMKSTAQLFIAQQSNLAFMLEDIVNKQFTDKA